MTDPAKPRPEATKPRPRIKVATYSLAELAEGLGLSRRTLDRLVARRLIAPVEAGHGPHPSRYDPLDCARRILADRAHARERRDQAQADLLEHRLATEQGAVLPKAEYVARGQRLASALTAKIRSLPSRLVRHGVITDVREHEAMAAVDELLTEIATWESELDLQGPTDA